jgi:type I restriction enzyme S subunit
MGEDGTVADEYGFPIIQHVYGKFWTNNHTHILQATNGMDNNMLELILNSTNVKSIITGAVQPKINQANMNGLNITIPTNYKNLQIKIKPLFEKRLHLIVVNKKLDMLKQLYLKKFFG